MAYGEKYNLTFDDLEGNEWEVQILEDGYSSTVTDLTGSGTPLTFNGESSDNGLFSLIRGTVATLVINCTAHDQYDELLKNHNSKYRMDVYRNSVLYFSGWVEQRISTRHVQKYNQIELRAVCGIGYLKNYEFKNDDEFYTGYKTKYSCLYDCLTKIDDNFKLYDATNLWAVGASYNLSPLTQEYQNTKLFRKSKTEAWTCYEVVEEICRSKLAKLYKYGDGWFLVPCKNTETTLVPRILTGSAGTHNGTTSLAVNKQLTSATGSPICVPINKSARLEHLPAINRQRVNCDHKYKNDLFRPVSEDDFTHQQEGYNTSDFDFNYETDKLTFRTLNTGSLLSPSPYDHLLYSCGQVYNESEIGLNINFEFDQVTTDYEVGIYIDIGGSNYYALDDDGNWNYGTYLRTIESTDESFKITTEAIPADGELFIKIGVRNHLGPITSNFPYHIIIDTERSTIGFYVSVPFSEDTQMRPTSYDVRYGNTESYYNGDDIDLKTGAYSPYSNGGGIMDAMTFTYSGGVYTRINDWCIDGGGSLSYLAAAISYIVVMAQSSIKDVLDVAVYSDILYPISQPVYLDKMFSQVTYEYDVKHCRYTFRGYEIDYYDEIYLELEDGTGNLELEDGNLLVLQ